MADPLTVFWRTRLDTLQLNLRRIQALLEDPQAQFDAALVGKFVLAISRIGGQLKTLVQQVEAQDGPGLQWQTLNEVMAETQAEIDAQLEILGGLGISRRWKLDRDPESGAAGGFTLQAEAWLNEVRKLAGLDRQLTVLPSRGPLFDVEKGLVRLPFLDWDLWHLPLLARSVGLLAPEDNPIYETALAEAVSPVTGQVEALFTPPPTSPPADLERLLPAIQQLWARDQSILTDEGRAAFRKEGGLLLKSLAVSQRDFLVGLYADLLATALVGPGYAIAVFLLELDYRSPNQFSLADPDLIEGRETAPRYLPGSVHRAAALLAGLRFLQQEAYAAGDGGLYLDITEKLTKLWHEVVASAQQKDDLEAVESLYAPWLEALWSKAVQPQVSPLFGRTTSRWRAAGEWCAAFTGGDPPAQNLPALDVLVGALWQHRLDNPSQANRLIRMVLNQVPGKYVPLKSQPVPFPQTLALTRLERLRNRWKRLSDLLENEQVPEADRAAVAGRFYRLISAQWYDLERAQAGLEAAGLRFSTWGKIEEMYAQARPLQREGLEFFGGLVVSAAKLDHELPAITGSQPGPGIAALATGALRVYARKTGVNWSARAVLGRDPFLETSTEVIRVRFPDWSVWNLPLMAHEFGHLTALSTPDFRTFQETEAGSLAPGEAARLRHLDEFFADSFAVYTCGPAFACDAILLHFNPLEANRERGVHPTHQERVQVILYILERINEAAKDSQFDSGPYRDVIAGLRDAWEAAVAASPGPAQAAGAEVNPGTGVTPQTTAAASAVAAAFTDRLEQTNRWARNLFRMVDTNYRLGVGYSKPRWEFARDLADLLAQKMLVPNDLQIRELAGGHGLQSPDLFDILNGLWLARLRNLDQPQLVPSLTRIANALCQVFGKG